VSADGFVPEVWEAVDALTKPSTRPVLRDDDTKVWAIVPSLWQQVTLALVLDRQQGSTYGGSLASERSPLDLDLLALRELITRTTTRGLVERRQRLRVSTPARLRQLAAYVITNEPDDLWWWAYRFRSWVAHLSVALAVGDHRPNSVRLRNAPCPSCGARSVTVPGDDGPKVAPPLVIDFRGDVVRAAECAACGRLWWRGSDLSALAEQLHRTTLALA
jgi:hypothetical protein